MQITSTVPIIMAVDGGNPIELGLVEGYARPSANVTGITVIGAELMGKRLEWLRMALGDRSVRIAVLWNKHNPAAVQSWVEVEASAPLLRVDLLPLEIEREEDFAPSVQAAAHEDAQGILVVSDPLVLSRRRPLIELINHQRLPSMYASSLYTQAGGLMSYGPNFVELRRRTAAHVDKVLRGTTVSSIPVERPHRFSLLLNLQTARAIDFDVPRSLLVEATEVIQ
jgi:putative ABC transport system substrate-binding protein